MVCTKLKIGRAVSHERGCFCIDKLYRTIDHNVASYVEKRGDNLTALYCYEDCAEESFTAAKAKGVICLYDLPIGYWRAMHRLLERERCAHPKWAMTLGGFNDSPEKLARKEHELALADRIFVASSFTKSTLEEYPGKLAPIEVIPYGFPPINKRRRYSPIEGRKIKLLYVGALSQRKGIATLFEAIDGLDEWVEMTIIGSGDIDSCPTLKEALSRVRHIPTLPHHKVLEQMTDHDALLFPTLFEGFGLVVTEAMSQGTPVITTTRGCGADIITHGVDGWIVEAGSSQSLRSQIEELIASPSRLTEAGKAAISTAAKRPWWRYEEEIAAAVVRAVEEVTNIEKRNNQRQQR